MLRLLIEKDSCELDLFRIKEFDWPFPIHFIHEGDFDAVLSREGLRLRFDGFQQFSAPFSWSKRVEKWKRDRTINNNLLRALGVKKNDFVVDATLGFGDDSSFLLSQGLKLHCYERYAPLFFAHQSSLLLENDDNLPVEITFGEASQNVKKTKSIYFDPMYDDGKERKAASRKEMSFLHSKIGGDDDSQKQGEALRNLCDRLVVKRTPKAPDLLLNKNSSWKTKSVRFDLYL